MARPRLLRLGTRKAGSGLSRTCQDVLNRNASRTRRFEPMLEIPEFLAAEHMKGEETSVSVFSSFSLPTPPLSHYLVLWVVMFQYSDVEGNDFLLPFEIVISERV